jgi:small GTP-binding protein
MDLKVVVLGTAFVGKTSIINRYCNQIFNNQTPSTVGAGFFTHSLRIDDTDVTAMLWDTAGDERFRSVMPSILRGAHGLILVFDLTNPQSFSEIDIYLDMFLDKCPVDPNYPPPVLLLGNKADLPERGVSRNEIDIWKQKNRVPFYSSVSAKSGDGIEKAVHDLLKFLASGDSQHLTTAIDIGLTRPGGGKECC